MIENKVEECKCPSCGVSLKVLIKEEDKPTLSNVNIEGVRQALPQDVLPDLNVALSKRTSPEMIHIVPKKFLGKENFYKVMEVVKAMNGEWVSQGKHSYWWVPSTQEAAM